MKIGIGISTFNRNDQVIKTIEKIREFTKSKYKLVVVDDGSRVPVKDATFRFGVNQGAPIAKNKCLELLEDCEHIFLFDDDTFPIKKGWEDIYINSRVKHLNYSFKHKFKFVNGLLYFDWPNGCMMYIHNSVLQKVGGFDTGFIKYGHWHGAFSNRVYNVGLIPHPFIDVKRSWEYIYCMDQDKTNNHRSATPNQGQFLAKNKLRYFEKIDSTEFIPFKKSDRPKIFYSNPYDVDKNIGRALNEFCEIVPEDAWICLQDGDMRYLTPDWGRQINDTILKYGNEYGLIGCMTNRIGRQTQRIGDIDNSHDVMKCYEDAIDLEKSKWAEIKPIGRKEYIAGFFMLFHKSTWNKVKFVENNRAFDDVFCIDLRKQGFKLGVLQGLFVDHFYRGWSANPSKDRKHLEL